MQIPQPVEPFGEVSVHTLPSRELEVVATILMKPSMEGARYGLALDASESMENLYGAQLPPIFEATGNKVAPVARTISKYLADSSSNGLCDVVYFALGIGGGEIQQLKELSSTEASTAAFIGPTRGTRWGTGTQGLPLIKYFVSKFASAKWSMVVIVTDGDFDDQEKVKDYCYNYGKLIASGTAPPIKFVLLAVGKNVNQQKMEELDDLFEGSGLVDPAGNEVDIWDHVFASDVTDLKVLYKEVVSKDMIVAQSGVVSNQSGVICAEYRDGLPAFMRFRLPNGSTSFKLEFPGGSVEQPIPVNMISSQF